jgi:transcriptional regulator with XRE-family HTH domain
MTTRITLGAVLRDRRGTRTQADVAAAAGISRSYLSELETGVHTNPPRHILLRLAEALDIGPAALLAVAGHPVAPGDMPDPRPDFIAFVETEPTLPTREARSAVLAVYHLVAVIEPKHR